MKRTFTRTLTLSLLLGMLATTTSCFSSEQKAYAYEDTNPLVEEEEVDGTGGTVLKENVVDDGETQLKPEYTQPAPPPAPSKRTFGTSYSDRKIKCAYRGISRTYQNMTNPATLSEDLDGDGRKESITIHVNQIEEVIATKGQYGSNLLELLDIPDYSSIFDENGYMTDDCSIHVALHDFDKDGKLEVILMVGNNIENYVTIFRVRDAGYDSYMPIGTFDAQREIILRGQHITAPFGTRGLSAEYQCDGHRIVEIDNFVQ